uniref:Uncharacterized protein n=1 Tax=Anguilla anguilla TaxID=7936 RepID=A0A0E9RC40_ANGAN
MHIDGHFLGVLHVCQKCCVFLLCNFLICILLYCATCRKVMLCCVVC